MARSRNHLVRRALVLALAAGLGGGVVAPWLSSARAIEYADGTIEFSYPLRLLDSRATRTTAGDSSVTYYLTIDFPAQAEEPLDRIEVQLEQGRAPELRYRLSAIEVFQETDEGWRAVSLGEPTHDRQTQTLMIPFDPPLEPGGELVLALRPVRNPIFAGVYLFSTRAFPVGETVRPRFMGYARLSFYERERRRWP